ncbi:MAG: helix-turn-helix transcriptional regulator [Sphingobacteriales bacterium]|nr:helix-turn-helix transcriptional regulator [Sphingobacteriales bacterium]
MTNYSLHFLSALHDGDPVSLNLLEVKKAALIIRAVNHKLRQQMLKLIDEQGKITVTDLYQKLFLEQSVVSQHLAILRKAGFVKTAREGKFIFYSINANRFGELNECIGKLLH